VAAIAYHTGLSAFRLLRQVFQIKGADQSLDTNVDFAGYPVLNSPNFDLPELQPLIDTREILLISRDAI
jgi:hypothetical protein